jgi:nucleotide-binding universal stress UspA family protein
VQPTHDEENEMILVSYDGSADARVAIERVAQLMPGRPVTIVTVWEPFVDALLRGGGMGFGLGIPGPYGDASEIDKSARDAAFAQAHDGAQRATAVGLVAQSRCAKRVGDIANTIIATADEVDADVIVVGTRGLSAAKSFLLGSVSHGVVQHADRAVLVVPSRALAERRRDHVHRDAVPA